MRTILIAAFTVFESQNECRLRDYKSLNIKTGMEVTIDTGCEIMKTTAGFVAQKGFPS